MISARLSAAASTKARLAALKDALGLEAEQAAKDEGLIPALMALLTDEDARVRQSALDALGQLQHRSVIAFPAALSPTIRRRALDDAPEVRAECAVALALLPPDDATEVTRCLNNLLRDADPRVRREAAAALGDLGDRAQVLTLEPLLEDTDDGVRFEACFALASLGSKTSLPLLLGALETPHLLDACEALRRLGDPSAAPALKKAAARFFLGWPEKLTLLAAAASLGDLEAGQALVGRTKALLREERALAIALLGASKVSAARGPLEAIALDPKNPLREGAIYALSELGLSESRPCLERLAADPDAGVAGAAREALERLRGG